MAKLEGSIRKINWATASPATELVGYVRTIGGMIYYNDGNSFAQASIPNFSSIEELNSIGTAEEFGVGEVRVGGVRFWSDGVSFSIVTPIVTLTQAAYTALSDKDAGTLYVIV